VISISLSTYPVKALPTTNKAIIYAIYKKKLAGFFIDKEKDPNFIIAAKYLSRKCTNIKH
jgi:hypothetical protein